MDRRSLLSTLAAMAASAIAALLALPSLLYLLSPLRRREAQEEWIDLGALDSLPDRIPVLIPYEVRIVDGWARRTVAASAWVSRRGAGAAVWSSTCPHLGCAVRYLRENARFACPCHASAFGADGQRLAGPSPRDLDPLPLRIEGGRLHVRHVAYRPGGRERVPA